MWLTALESILIVQDTSTKAYGRTIWQMVKDKQTTQMEAATMDNFSTTKDMEKEY